MFDQWQAQLLALILLKARVGPAHARSGRDAIRRAHLEPVADIAAGSPRSSRESVQTRRIAVLPEGPMTIPYLLR